jgi:hypothetical protein
LVSKWEIYGKYELGLKKIEMNDVYIDVIVETWLNMELGMLHCGIIDQTKGLGMLHCGIRA